MDTLRAHQIGPESPPAAPTDRLTPAHDTLPQDAQHQDPQPWSPSARDRLLRRALRLLPLRHGKHRLLDRLAPAPADAPEQWVTIDYHGTPLRLDAADLVGRHFCMLHSFDPEVIDVLHAFAAGENDLLWDVGANCGTTSYQMLRRVPDLRVVAVEPQPVLAGVLEENLARLAPGRAGVRNVALGERSEELELAVPLGNRGKASLTAHAGDQRATRVRVPVVTADHLRDATGGAWPTLIKIDVEGFEPAVIRGLAPALASATPRAVVFEHHAPRTDPDFVDMRTRLEDAGYTVMAIAKSALSTSLQPLDAHAPTADYAAIRRDLLSDSSAGTPTPLRALARRAA